MMAFAIYLLKASACMALFYLLYRVVFAPQTFFQLNRFYLLSSLMLSVVVPLITIPVERISAYEIVTLPIDQLPDYGTDYVSNFAASDSTFHHLIPQFALFFYASGVSILLSRLFLGMRRFFLIKKSSTVEHLSEGSILRANTAYPFTFFRWVVVGPESPREVILHERAHARQLHSVDILFVELMRSVFWFNPVAHWYRSALEQQHEYLADAYVIDQIRSPQKYLSVMLQQIARGVAPEFASKFSSSLIKNRIFMITKNRSSYMKLSLYVLVVPVVAMLIFSFSTTERKLTPSIALAQNETIAPKVLQSNIPSESPVDMTRLKKLQGYGDRMHPVLNKVVKHTGIDFILDEGEDVMSTADGVVVTVATDEKRGNYIVIKHNDEYTTNYFHLKSFLVKEGQRVKSKEVIGKVGNTGLSQSFHLHYEVIKSGVSVDPVKYLPQ